MKTFNFVIPPQLKSRLEAESSRSGVSLAEIARRALDEFLERKEGSVGHGRPDAAIEATQEPALARG